MRKIILISTFLVLLFTLSLLAFNFLPKIAYSQDTQANEKQVTCGDIVENEFVNNAEDHIYLLPMQPKESFDVALEPAGDDLKTVIAIYGPSGLRIKISGEYGEFYPDWWVNQVSQAPKLTSGRLSATGFYKIRVANTAVQVKGHQDMASDKLRIEDPLLGGVGAYTLFIGCTKADQVTRIEPGDLPQLTPTLAPLPSSTPLSTFPDSVPTFTGVGFPGLAPVDFSSVAKVPLLLDTVMTGVIPTGNEILGFTLNAEAGDTLDLIYTRASGNMNLGLVVLSENNEVFFQASLVTSESLSTRFTLPEAGQYTIGVFRISLVEPETVEPTVFQLKGTITK